MAGSEDRDLNTLDPNDPLDRQGPGAACEPARRAIAERAAGTHPAQAAHAAKDDDDMHLAPVVLRHVASCAPCRALLARRDPTALFSLLALERKDDAFWTGFETRVMASIREMEREPRGWVRPLLRPRTIALALGASMIAAAALLLKVSSPMPPPSVRGVAAPGDLAALTHQEPREALPAGPQTTKGMISVPAPGVPAPGVLASGQVWGVSALSLERNAASPAPVETVLSPTARVLTINVEGKGREEADVVMIVDRRIDI